MSDFYNTDQGVQQYIDMCEGMDGRWLIDQLVPLIPNKARVLEIGSGPGIDLAILNQHFAVTGSDQSPNFIKVCKDRNPTCKVVQLNATTLEIQGEFQAIYSNKVLHHLSKEDLHSSLQRQTEILAPTGIVMHTFWEGTGTETHAGLFFQKYTITELESLFTNYFSDVKIQPYKELVKGDSLVVIASR